MVSGCWKSWVRSPSAVGPIAVAGVASAMVVNGVHRAACKRRESDNERKREKKKKMYAIEIERQWEEMGENGRRRRAIETESRGC